MNITNLGLLPAVHALLSRAGMVDTALQETLPACSATPTTASLTNQWVDQLTVLSHQMAGRRTPSVRERHFVDCTSLSLQCRLQSLQVVSTPPPLHSLPPCSVTLTPCQEKPPRQPSPLSSSSSSSSSKKMKPPQHSPASRSQFIMVAAEATTLLQAADDLVPGLDERMIMRVDNTLPAPGGPSSSSPAHYGSSDSSCETTPTAPPTCVPDPAFLSATLVPPSLTSWTPPDLSLPSTSSIHPSPALTSAK
ncbi:hypothetical protein GBAR_LOCUS26401 [Geodia barretti]|uniref:Uncharacterized protein n=1 Tax=Geodia barretti TaxID=519541 RepID=A0AA35XCU5_GEOBA|nr:hypothetical protein GBAR_LOCUS26401 [Geodia barretti]